MRICGAVALAMLGCVLVSAQPPLRFKTRQIETGSGRMLTEIRHASGSGHLVVQFETQPTAVTVEQLKRRGVAVLQDVPENGLLVFVSGRVAVGGLGIRYAAPIDPADKISPLARSGFLLVEFHPDVNINRARQLLLNLGVELHDNPDLNPHHLLVRTDNLKGIAQLDEVAYIFPASSDLIHGIPTRPCEGALTVNGPTAQSIPTYGKWGGPTIGAATIYYVFSQMTAQLDTGATEAAIESAMAQWSKAVQVTWQPGSGPTADQTVNILFATGDHPVLRRGAGRRAGWRGSSRCSLLFLLVLAVVLRRGGVAAVEGGQVQLPAEGGLVRVGDDLEVVDAGQFRGGGIFVGRGLGVGVPADDLRDGFPGLGGPASRPSARSCRTGRRPARPSGRSGTGRRSRCCPRGRRWRSCGPAGPRSRRTRASAGRDPAPAPGLSCRLSVPAGFPPSRSGRGRGRRCGATGPAGRSAPPGC